MKFLLLLTALCIGIYADKTLLTTDETDLIQLLERELQKRCMRNGRSEIYNDLLKYKDDMIRTCIENGLMQGNDEDLGRMVCRRLRQSGYRCLTDLVNRIRPCLTNEDRHFTNFIFDIYNVTFDHVCRRVSQTPTSDRKLIDFGLGLMECRRTLEECIMRTDFIRNLKRGHSIARTSDLCKDIRSVKDCIITRRKENEGFPEFLSLFDEYITLCERI